VLILTLALCYETLHSTGAAVATAATVEFTCKRYDCLCMYVIVCDIVFITLHVLSVWVCVCAVIKKSIVSAGQAMNIYERRVLSSVREVFLVFVLVFYIW